MMSVEVETWSVEEVEGGRWCGGGEGGGWERGGGGGWAMVWR